MDLGSQAKWLGELHNHVITKVVALMNKSKMRFMLPNITKRQRAGVAGVEDRGKRFGCRLQVIFPDAVSSILLLGRSSWSEQSFKPHLQIVLKGLGTITKFSQGKKKSNNFQYVVSGIEYLSVIISPPNTGMF